MEALNESLRASEMSRGQIKKDDMLNVSQMSSSSAANPYEQSSPTKKTNPYTDN